METYYPIAAAILAFAITALLGFKLVPFLRKAKYGQTILDIGPSWHKSKEGTPTMGGILFIVGILVSVFTCIGIALATGNNIYSGENDLLKTKLYAGIGLAVSMGMIGFLDDYIKVVKKQNKGLSVTQKTFIQLLVAALFLWSLYLGGMNTTWIPLVGEVSITSGFGLIFWIIAEIFIYGFLNAPNLTDGIDGLCTTVTTIVLIFFMLLSMSMSSAGMNLLASASAGACVGFLLWNMHPAKIIMGDTGSMFLGGLVVALAFGVGKPILLLLVGVVYLIEALSVVIQVSYYKRTKKRLFKMSPIHHHFELCGWSENKIVIIFALVTVVGCALAALLLKISV